MKHRFVRRVSVARGKRARSLVCTTLVCKLPRFGSELTRDEMKRVLFFTTFFFISATNVPKQQTTNEDKKLVPMMISSSARLLIHKCVDSLIEVIDNIIATHLEVV